MHAASSPPGRLRLANHVRACAIDGQVILLDLLRSKYIGVAGRQSHVLASAVEGWPPSAGECPASAAALSVDIDKLASPLSAQGLLTSAPGPRPLDAALQEANSSLNAEDADVDPTVGWHRLARLLCASTTTAVQLRARSLASVAHAARARRLRSKCSAASVPLETLQEAVAAYLRLRLYVFTVHDRCLHDSLTLLRFLAADGIFPSWVIGVRTRPFGAHSWLQSGPMVLNDQHEHVRRYQPILVV